jgi:hypothetical protein
VIEQMNEKQANSAGCNHAPVRKPSPHHFKASVYDSAREKNAKIFRSSDHIENHPYSVFAAVQG